MKVFSMKNIVSTILLQLTLALFVSACGKSNSTPAASQKRGGVKFPVQIETVRSRAAEFTIQAVGSVEAYEIVEVTARVPGIVRDIKFMEGRSVKKDEPLAEIEPERFTLALKSAEAQFQKACAVLKESRAGLIRRTDMLQENPGFVSKEELDNWTSRTEALQADSAQAAAAFEIAKLNLRDSFIPAPVSGIIQSRTIRTGQYLQTGTVIATLVRRDPLLLRFTIPEQDASRVRHGQVSQFRVRGIDKNFTAKITSVAETADLATRMVPISAEVNDPDRDELRPGSFAEVTILLGEAADRPIIPQMSIRPSERGFLAYVVKDSTVSERVLSLGMQTADGYVEVKSGVEAGEKIVVRGAEALRDNAGIRIIQGGDSVRAVAKDSSAERKS